MPDRPCPGLITKSLSIGLSQDGSEQLVTGDITTNKIKLASSITIIGTWNVITRSRCGKLWGYHGYGHCSHG